MIESTAIDNEQRIAADDERVERMCNRQKLITEFGRDKYYEHFHMMVTMGICCGLDHPVEWLVNYDRAIAAPYHAIPEIRRFVEIAAIDLYEWVHMEPPEDWEQVSKWISSYYNREPIGGSDERG